MFSEGVQKEPRDEKKAACAAEMYSMEQQQIHNAIVILRLFTGLRLTLHTLKLVMNISGKVPEKPY